MLNLETQQYDMNILENNLLELNLLKVVRTQKLTLEFIKKFILNEEYQITPEEQYIDKYYVLKYQTHISLNELNDE